LIIIKQCLAEKEDHEQSQLTAESMINRMIMIMITEDAKADVTRETFLVDAQFYKKNQFKSKRPK
jgi:hypothetical protein